MSSVRANVEGEELVMETAMDVVRRASAGKIDHDELIRTLKTWDYESQYKTAGLGDDWQTVPTSFDAVEFAYMSPRPVDRQGICRDRNYHAPSTADGATVG